MVQKTILGNGVRVVTEHLPFAQSVSIGILIGRGSRHEDAEEQGITHFIEHMLLKSSSTCSAMDVAKKIDAIGGPFNAFTGREYSFLHLHTVVDQFRSAVWLLDGLLGDVSFAPDAVEKERHIIAQEIKHLHADGGEYIHDLLSQTFWDNSALGSPVTGTLESVASISPARLEQFYRHEYLNACIIVAVVGNLEHAEVVETCLPVFEKLAVYTQLPDSDPGRPRRRISLYPRPDSQAYLCFGFPALPQNHHRRFAGILLDAIWGGGISSRIFQRIREQHGWAYNLYSYLNSYSDSGCMATMVETDADHVAAVVESVRNEICKLLDDGITQDELDAARRHLQIRLKMGQDSTHARMERLGVNELYRGCYVPVYDLMASLDRVAPEEVVELAREMMRDDSLVACMLGPLDSACPVLQNMHW